MDNLTRPERSRQMASVRNQNTKPELAVRRALFAMGYRYRIHYKKLPGSPDIAFPSRRKVIFVHGCFWHRHSDAECRLTRTPKSRKDFWESKFSSNVERDKANFLALEKLGWEALVVWECEIRHMEHLRNMLRGFLSDEPRTS
jgi:DNA mismatch endonuclease (patch repair protein)